jgi:hypothetical protein
MVAAALQVMGIRLILFGYLEIVVSLSFACFTYFTASEMTSDFKLDYFDFGTLVAKFHMIEALYLVNKHHLVKVKGTKANYGNYLNQKCLGFQVAASDHFSCLS